MLSRRLDAMKIKTSVTSHFVAGLLLFSLLASVGPGAFAQEVLGTVGRLDAAARTVVIDGQTYRLAENFQIRSQVPVDISRYQKSPALLAGKRVTFDTAALPGERRPVITELWVQE
jgi:hypothetical protein